MSTLQDFEAMTTPTMPQLQLACQFGKLDLANSSVCELPRFPCTNHNCGGTRPHLIYFPLASQNHFKQVQPNPAQCPWLTCFYFILDLNYNSYPPCINIFSFCTWFCTLYLQCIIQPVSLQINNVSVSSIQVPSPQPFAHLFCLLTLMLSDFSFELAPAPCHCHPCHHANTPLIPPIPWYPYPPNTLHHTLGVFKTPVLL